MKTKVLFTTILFILVTCLSVFSQDKYLTTNGKVSFYSHTDMEDVAADNNQVTSYININTGEVAFQMLIKSFKFDRSLMEEHFNENYMESETYPKSEFKGTISNLSDIDFTKAGKYDATVTGKLTIHGVTKDVTTTGIIEVVTEKILLVTNIKLLVTAKFNVASADYGIVIPDLVKEKIAKNMEVTVDMIYEPYKK
jgi:polyisoprenoid-binding protein YceI